MSELAQKMGCTYPVIQGALGMVSNAELTAAVAEAGGLGLLAGWNISDPAELKAKLDVVRNLTSKPCGANLMAMNPKALELAEMLLDNGIKTFTVSAGNPSEIVPFLKKRGAFVISVTGSVSAAKKAEALGVDAIVAEGTESGGMQGHNVATTMVLVPQVVDAVSVPVLAAGGIADYRGYRAAFALGAQGVQVGTCLVASRECIAPDHRGFESHPLPAGQVAGLIREVKTVRQIIEGMVA